MPLPPIVAIVVPAETAPDLAAAVLRACNLALGSGRCVSASSAPGLGEPVSSPGPANSSGSGPGNAWVGTVSLEPDQPNLLRVELGDAVERATRTRFTRTLTFDGTEATTHRWSTAGVVVAALVISAESSNGGQVSRNRDTGTGAGTGDSDPATEGSPSAASPRAASSTSVTAKTKTPSRKGDSSSESSDGAGDNGPDYRVKSTQFRLDAGAFLASGMQNGPLRRGVTLHPSLAFGPNLLAWSSISASLSDAAVQAVWWSGAAGLGFATTDRRGLYGIEARLGLRGERVGFSTSSGTTEAHDFRFRWGGLGGVDLTLSLSQPLALWVGAEAGLMGPTVVVKRRGEEVGRLTSLDTAVQLGFRLRLGGWR